MASADFTINGSSCPPEKAVSYGATVTLALLSTAFNTATWSIVGSDRPETPIPSITPSGSPLGATATFTMVADPGTGFGASLLVQCVINGGRDSAGQVDSALTKRAIVGVVNTSGVVPFVVGEAMERSTTHGYTALMNQALSAIGAPGAPGAGVNPAPALVATSNIALTGVVTVDGVASNTVTGEVLCTAQTTTAQNGYWTPNASGAWTRPTYYNSDATVAATLGQPSAAVLGGLLGAGSVWSQRSGVTIVSSKTWVRLPDAADKALIVAIYYSGDTSGVTDTAHINAALAYVKAMGGGCVQLPVAKFWVNDDLLCEVTQGCELAGSAIGGGGPTYSTQIIRVGASSFATGYRAFTQPAINSTVVVTVDSTVGMVVGKYCHTAQPTAAVAGNHYQITAISPGVSVTLKNIGSTGNSVATTSITAGFLRSSDAIVQMRSASFSCVRDIQLQAASPLFTGRGVNFDGNVFGQDVAKSGVFDATIITTAFTATNPALIPLDGSTHPVATLTGSATISMDLLVEILSSTTYRYSTDGGRTYDENSDTTPLTIAATHVFPAKSNAFGLTLNLPAGTYANGYKYSCRLGIQRGIDYQNCFTVTTDNVRFDRVMDGIFQSGQGGRHHCSSIHLGGYTATYKNCNFMQLNADAEPGGNGYGRGGLWSDNGTAGRYWFNAGDQLTEGSWIWLRNELNPEIDGIYGIDPASTGRAGAAVSLLGCSDVVIKGSYGCNKVFDVSRTGTATLGIYVKNVLGFTWDGVTNTLYSGSNAGFINYDVGGVRTISGALMINAFHTQNGAICGPGTQTFENNTITIGGQRSTALAWNSCSGAGAEIANSAHGYGDGVIYYSRQNVAAGGHSFLVRDSAATNGQRPGLRVSQLGVCHPGTAITLANGANNDIAIRSSYVEITGPTGAFSISGFVPDSSYSDGQILEIVWTVSQALTIKHDSTSTAAFRTVTDTAADVVCATPAAGGYGRASFRYSAAASRWRLLGHS